MGVSPSPPLELRTKPRWKMDQTFGRGERTCPVPSNATRAISGARNYQAGMMRPGDVPCRMKEVAESKPVERLFPFVLRSRNLIVGRDTLSRSKSKLHFVLIT